jgi:LacI family transcriptional regulator
MNNKRITIADVAKKAGVSKQTVSRVINDKPDVAPQTRQHIKDLIKSMGYTPDPIARSMKGSTHTFGCITPNLNDYNLATIIQAAQLEAQKNGYFIWIGSAQSEFDVFPLLNEMMDRRIDGLMVINPRDDNRYRYLKPLIESKTPIVYIKNTPAEEPVSAVCLDDVAGGYMATQYLTSLGHNAIAIILGPVNEECTHKRLEGFRKALHESGLQDDPRLIVQGDWSASSGKTAISKLLGYEMGFTAIFAQNDQMAIGAMQAVREAGLRIPDDISILGYDDLPLTGFTNPPLTTIRQPMAHFGEVAVKLLLKAIKQPGSEPELVRLEPALIVRESCSLLEAMQ